MEYKWATVVVEVPRRSGLTAWTLRRFLEELKALREAEDDEYSLREFEMLVSASGRRARIVLLKPVARTEEYDDFTLEYAVRVIKGIAWAYNLRVKSDA